LILKLIGCDDSNLVVAVEKKKRVDKGKQLVAHIVKGRA
jgi:hypothetical protein